VPRSNIALRNLVVSLCMMLFLMSPLHPFQEVLDARAQVRKAVDAADQGRHEESYRIWADLVSRGPSTLGKELYRFARSQVYQEAYKKIGESGEDCSMALQWVEKGKSPGLPNYDSPSDAFYPLLLMAEGVCYAKQEKYEQAYTQLELAKIELRKIPDEDMADVMRQADQYLNLVKEHVISVGDYVTNKGLLQAWIGKVMNRRGNILEVSVTYANKELGTKLLKGQRAEILVTDCKELGAISADAALKGWK
jgi:hypothetical protein